MQIPQYPPYYLQCVSSPDHCHIIDLCEFSHPKYGDLILLEPLFSREDMESDFNNPPTYPLHVNASIRSKLEGQFQSDFSVIDTVVFIKESHLHTRSMQISRVNFS